MNGFVDAWAVAATTSVGFFWMAFWAFGLGYLLSSLIQLLVSRQQMSDAMGSAGPRSVALGTFFGFVSSSCSFAALSTTRALFQKGAGLVPSLAFMLASTNLVVELGIVIGVFLGWQFVVGEYAGGVLLILFAWAWVRITRPRRLVERARAKARGGDDAGGDDPLHWRDLLHGQGWHRVARTYVMEWLMVWKDVLIGFTVAGVIAGFVPDSFFAALFPGSAGGAPGGLPFLDVLLQAVVAPLAALFTFIGSMGNIPLAALLFDRGVGFAGVMAFIFSDLVVVPVLRINARYYGWPMALYIAGMLLCGLVAVSVSLHYLLLALDLLPTAAAGSGVTERSFFKVDYSLVLNLLFLGVSVLFAALWWRQRDAGGQDSEPVGWLGWLVRGVVACCVLWLCGGVLVAMLA